METILIEFRAYLQAILDAHSQHSTLAQTVDTGDNAEDLESFTVDYNNKSISKAIEILSDNTLLVDKEQLRIELSNIIRQYSNKFFEEHFNGAE